MGEFDPWDTETPTERVEVGGKSFPKTLVERARKRVPDVVRTGGRRFVVVGNDKFNDTYPQYEVSWYGGTDYECFCYSLEHGETRARNGCTHVVAVMLYREANGHVVTDGANGKEQGNSGIEVQLTLGDDLHTNGTGHMDIPRESVPSISDPLWTQWDNTPLPSKFTELRPHQWTAVEEIIDAYKRGVECVYVDAPTGSGKSLIAELVRRVMNKRAFYICHSKSLQQQFLSDFTYARLLMGRSNYETLDPDRDITCADCTSSGPEDECLWCWDRNLCPYQIAKREAIQSKLAILNTAYFLTEFNYVGHVGQQRELGVIDECDTLEGELMGFAEFSISDRLLGKLGLTAPKEGSHYKTLGAWLINEFKPRLHEHQKTIRGEDVQTIRARNSAARLMGDVLRIESQFQQDESMENWVRDNKAGPFVLKPVQVGDYGDRYVWGHAQNWLNMSATIISPDELSDSCGLVGGQGEGRQGRRWEMVTVPMTFPVENRQVIVAPIADMSRKGKDNGEWEYAATALLSVAARHPNERILVHTVSYELARYLMDRVARPLDRPVLSYTSAKQRDYVLSQFRRSERAILIASSMDRGIDLAGDECRVQVVAKIPFPYLGDPQVSKRMNMPGGQTWYAVQAVRKLVQMTGRAVRSSDDWCVTYIFDRQMTSNILKKHRGLLPKWWQEALVTNFPVKELLSA